MNIYQCLETYNFWLIEIATGDEPFDMSDIVMFVSDLLLFVYAAD